MNPGTLYGRGIGFPPRVGADGRVAWSEGETNVRESIRIILLTEERERVRLPEFGGGLGRYLFEPNTATTRQLILDRIQRALGEWEARIRVVSVSVDAADNDSQSAIATITYRLVATGIVERVSLSVSLGGS
jgi:phage baseplate assembly protein W